MSNVSQSEDTEERRHQNAHDLGYQVERRLQQRIGKLERECTALTRQVALLESRNRHLTQQGERLMGQLRRFHQLRLGSKRYLSE